MDMLPADSLDTLELRHSRATKGTFPARMGLAVSLLVAAIAGTAQADSRSSAILSHGIRAVTQNLYLGTDIRRLLLPGDLSVNVARAYQIVESTRFEERAKALARLIAREHPQVIGLQEVASFRLIDPLTMAIKRDTDYLALLLKALDKQGAHYRVAGTPMKPAVGTNLTVTLPRCLQPPAPSDADQTCPGAIDYLQYADRDVILVSASTRRSKVTDQAHFQFNLPLVVGGQSTEILRGYLVIEAMIDGTRYRIANTHLEVTGSELGNPPASFYQQAQASELIGVLNGKPEPLPLVLLGDLNSAADDSLAQEGPNRPYQQFLDAGFVDTWAARPTPPKDPGNTCCRSETLNVADLSPLTDRIDFVFARNDAGKRPDALRVITARTFGTRVFEATPSGLWPSDHAGVSASLSFKH